MSSLSGEKLAQASLTSYGIEGDRAYGLFTKESGDIAFPSMQKKWNVAPQVSARYRHDGELELSTDELQWFKPDESALLDALETLFGVKMIALPYGEQVAGKTAEQRYAWSPIHLLSRQALDALKSHLPGHDVDTRRFRPNLIVDLPEMPGYEPELALLGKEFSIGALRLRGTRKCGRCSFTTLAQPGIPEDREVLRTLIQDFGKNFGIYCEVLNPASIAVGDLVRIDFHNELEKPVIIIGAGQAGAMMARSLRDLQYKGPIQLFGEERHLPYERPPLSKGYDLDERSQTPATLVLQPPDFDELEVDIHLNSRVVEILAADREIETQDGKRHPYKNLVIATGGAARRLPGLERGHGRVHVIRTLDDATNLWRALKSGSKLAVLGSGWLGLEVAAAARTNQCEVKLFARQGRVLSRTVPAEVAKFVEDRHRAAGVQLRLGETPRFRETATHIEIVTSDSAEQVDHLVLAVGITPNDHLARIAGLAVSDGIVADASGRTSDPHIFAAGDVARWISGAYPKGIRIESWQNANDQPRAIARAILSLPPEVPPLMKFWSSQFDMMVQIAGIPDPDAVAIDVDDCERPFWNFGSFAIGINRPREIVKFAANLGISASNMRTDMDAIGVPTLRQNIGPAEGTFIGLPDSFPEGEIRRVAIGGLGDVAITRSNGQFHAVNDKCPHADASLSEGFTEGGRIVCPLHFAEFDLRTGEAFNAPAGCGGVACYAVDQRADGLYLRY